MQPTSPNISIMYGNAQGKTGIRHQGEWADVQNQAATESWDVLLLNETHRREGTKNIRLQGYQVFENRRGPAGRKGGGLLIATKESLRAAEWERDEKTDDDNSEILWVQIQTQIGWMAVGVVYVGVDCPANRKVNKATQSRLAKDIQEMSNSQQIKNIVIAGDFNAHIEKKNGDWKGKDRQGRELLQITKTTHLSLTNDLPQHKGKWTWFNNNRKSTVDYVLACHNTINRIIEVEVDELGDKWGVGSDHSWVKISINTQPIKQAKNNNHPTKWNNATDQQWIKFRESLASLITSWMTHHHNGGDEDVRQSYKELTSLIVTAANREIGRRKRATWKKKDHKCRRALAKRRTARARWRQANISGRQTAQAWRKYQKVINDTKPAINLAYRKARDQWISRMLAEGGTSSKVLWNSLKVKSQGIKSLTKDGKVTSSPTEIKSIIEDYYEDLGKSNRNNIDENQPHQNAAIPTNPTTNNEASPSTNTPPTPSPATLYKSHQRTVPVMEESITNAEVAEAIRKLPQGAAPGGDQINNVMLKRGGDSLHAAIATIFEQMREEGWTPEEWNSESVQLIHKGKSKQDIQNYRGIAISSSLGKLFIRIITRRLEEIAERHKWLPEAQAAFRKNRGIEDHLFVLQTIISNERRKGKNLYLGFIDLQKAYDSVERNLLWKKLHTIGIGRKCIQLIQGLYRGHTRQIRTPGGLTRRMQCTRGLRQGCPLSPLLFALFTTSIPHQVQDKCQGVPLHQQRISILCYADDMLTLANSHQDMAKSLQIVAQECTSLDLVINPDKSGVMVFQKGKRTTKRSPSQPSPPRGKDPPTPPTPCGLPMLRSLLTNTDTTPNISSPVPSTSTAGERNKKPDNTGEGTNTRATQCPASNPAPTKDSTKGNWSIPSPNQGEPTPITQVEEYKYLGLKLNPSATFSKIRHARIKAAPTQLAILRAKSTQAYDKLKIGTSLWQAQQKNKLLFATQSFPATKQWITELDRVQEQAGRWVSGVSKNTSGARVCLDLNWPSMQAEIAMNKISWWAKVTLMDESRWPKCALLTMLENPTRFTWLKEVNQMIEDYNVTNECFAKKHPRAWIRRRVKKVDRNMRRNNIRIRCSHELVKEERLTKTIYQSYPKELWTRRARMGDWYSIFGAGIPDKCPVCDQRFRCPIQHIVRTCGTYDSARPTNSPPLSCEDIYSDNPATRRKVNSTIKNWVTTRQSTPVTQTTGSVAPAPAPTPSDEPVPSTSA